MRRSQAITLDHLGPAARKQAEDALIRDVLEKAAAGRGVRPRRSKYGAKRTLLDGITFDSKAEANRYAVLRRREKAGEIRDLQLQPKFKIIINGHNICEYRADFSYIVIATDKREVEDVKGVRTPVYRIKKKLVAAVLGVAITEVSSS
jgi:Protein of unknown function (DUF1064)